MSAAERAIELIENAGKAGITYDELQKIYQGKEPLYNVLYALGEPYEIDGVIPLPVTKVEGGHVPGKRGIEIGRFFYSHVDENLLKKKLDRVKTYWQIGE